MISEKSNRKKCEALLKKTGCNLKQKIERQGSINYMGVSLDKCLR